jgi:UDP-N-acetylglucosamine 2-epimerase (non-hydrolysing)
MTPDFQSKADVGLDPIVCVVGARPNYMKIAPLMRAFASEGLPAVLVHTGQHSEEAMFGRIFSDLGLDRPAVCLSVSQSNPAQQLAEMISQFDPLVDRYHPRAVLVVGDVTSTLACALVASKRGVPLVHVEAGLRSFDRRMPEEVNRVLTDHLSDLLFATEASAVRNLAREGIEGGHVVLAGNVMIDSLIAHLPQAKAPALTLSEAGFDPSLIESPQGFALATLHRPSNVDHAEPLASILGALREITGYLPVVLPLHPRTRHSIKRYGLGAYLDTPKLISLPPVGYAQMLGLMAHARVVLTDSGGVQEETTALGVPCLTLRENTERPITVEHGTNTLVGRDRSKIIAGVEAALRGGAKRGRRPELWDGHAASRIARHLLPWLAALPKKSCGHRP